MKVLVACEESQAVCKAFRELGHEAYSCDIQECSGGHPEWHIHDDALRVINGYKAGFGCPFFVTDGGTTHDMPERWDLIIAHPPCTYLCLSGQKHCNPALYGAKAIERQEKREEAVEFFMAFVNADCEKIAVENPVGIMTRRYKKPTQYIQPFMFGDAVSKKTGLWLKGLKPLEPTNIVEQEFHVSSTGRKWDKWFWDSSLISDLEERSRFRSKTFRGIAAAFADQWGGDIRDGDVDGITKWR